MERSPFAQALRNLLYSVPDTALKDWAFWLNFWYRAKNPDGSLTGTRAMLGMGGDIFDDPPTEAEIAARREDRAKNWVPCHEIGDGVSVRQIESWLNDEAMPEAGQINEILGYFDASPKTPEADEALKRFHAVLTVYAGNVTPHGRDFVFVKHMFGTIGARLVMERYGVIFSLLTLPPDKWDKTFNEVSQLLRKTDP
jgi:hypothetical protein